MNSLGSADFILNCFNSSYPKHNSTINYPKPNINHENNTMNLNYSNMDESLHKYEENQNSENNIEFTKRSIGDKNNRIIKNPNSNLTYNSKSENILNNDYDTCIIDENGNKFYYKKKEAFKSESILDKNLNDFSFVVRFDIKTIIIIILIIITSISYYKYNYYKRKYLKHTYNNVYKNNEDY